MQQQRQAGRWLAILTALTVFQATAAAPLNTADRKLIEMAASVNELALACGYVTAEEARTKQAQQRKIMLEQGLSASAYDQSYAQASIEARQQWAKQTPQQQKTRCTQVRE